MINVPTFPSGEFIRTSETQKVTYKERILKKLYMLNDLVFLPRKSRGQRNPASYSPRGHRESERTEGLNTFTLILCKSDRVNEGLGDAWLVKYLIPVINLL